MSKKSIAKETADVKITSSKKHPKTTSHSKESVTVEMALKSDKNAKVESKKIDETPKFNFQSPDFLKSTIALFISIFVVISLFGTSLALSGQYNFQKDTQEQFARINKELDSLKTPQTKANLQELKYQPPSAEKQKPTNQLGIEKPNLSYDNFTGSPDSRFVLVVYVDMECPFCKIMHENLVKIQREFPSLAIVYRHFPLEQIHKNALVLAKASECAKNVGGQNDFFKLTNSVFLNQNLLKYPSGLLKIIQNSGLNAVAIEECVRNNDTLDRVKYDQQEAIDKLGNKGFGTPTSILFDNGEETNVVINGAISYPELRQIVMENVR